MKETMSPVVEEVVLGLYLSREKRDPHVWSPWVNDEGILLVNHEEGCLGFEIDAMHIALEKAMNVRKGMDPSWKKTYRKMYVHYTKVGSDEVSGMWIAFSESQVNDMYRVLKDAFERRGY